MASWQSGLFTRLTRLSGSRTAGAGPEVLAELRAQHERQFARFGEPPADAEITVAQLGPVRGEWVRTEDSAPQRVILYFHGGGFIAGSPQSHRPLVARLCSASQACAFSVAYRLAPECPFPAALRDGLDAYRQLLSRGLDASAIVLAGDDAGGGLAFGCALAIRNAGLAMPAAVVAMSPWADLTLSGWSVLENVRNDTARDWAGLFVSARHYLKASNPADPYASPVFAGLHDFPPVMVHAGSAEILRDDASRLGDRAAEASVPVSVEIYDRMQHVFQADPRVPEGKVSLGRLGDFIRTRAHSTSAPVTGVAARG